MIPEFLDRIGLWTLAAVTALFGYLTLWGLLSLVGQRKEVTRKCTKSLKNSEYLKRQIYRRCWEAIYYFKPLYQCVLTVSPLKTYVFRLFGFRGNLNFTIAASTWIRDLNLLKLGERAVISPRATLGTSLSLSDQTLFSDHITLEPSAFVGPLCVLGPGARINQAAEVMTGTAVGIRSRIGEATRVANHCMISHGVTVGARTLVGEYTFIGPRATLTDRLLIPAGTIVPSGTNVTSQHEIDKYRANETKLLHETAQRLMAAFPKTA